MSSVSYAYDAERGKFPDERPKPDLQIARPGGKSVSSKEIMGIVVERRKAAKADRARYEPIWRLCQAFVAGRQWVGLTKRTGRVLEEPNPKKRERHTENVLTRRFWTAIGKLYDDNFMPNMQFARPDWEAQQFTEQAKAAFEFAWDEEINAGSVTLELLIEMCGYGTVMGRCRYDGSLGPHIGEVPVDENGRIIRIDSQDPGYEDLMQKMTFGEPVDWRVMREGRIVWDVISPFGFLPPPGIPYPQRFPWVIVEQPVALDEVKAMYGEAAADLTEQDLTQVDLIGDRDLTAGEDPLGGNGKLRGHVLLSQMYEKPTRDFPNGRTVTWTQDTFLQEKPQLTYTVNGEPKAGLGFFRYHRVPRRFWGIGIIEPAIGPQRQRNRARSQMIEMKDKNLGRVYARKGSLNESNTPVGKIMELIEVKQNAEMPTETQGVPPGPWIEGEVAANDRALDEVMGLGEVVGGESTRGITAYAAFALKAEEQDKRLGPIIADFRNGLTELSRFTAAAIRMYWPTDKKIILAGPDREVSSFVYNAAQFPEEVYFHFGKGAAAPRSQAAEIQKIFDVYDRSVSSGRPLGVEWLMNSLDAGRCIPFPENVQQLQRDKAMLENMVMSQGHPAQVSPTDDHTVHIEEHQLAAQQALLAGRQEVAMMIQEHIDQHQQAMQAQQQLVTSVPGMQGAMGALGGPQTQAANAGQGLAPALLALGMQMPGGQAPQQG